MNLHPSIAPAFALAACLGLSACTTVGPDYRLPEKSAINCPAAAKPFSASKEAAFQHRFAAGALVAPV